jgi:hypothetical protein
MNEFLLEYFVDVDKIYIYIYIYIFYTRDKYLVMWKNILSHVHG